MKYYMTEKRDGQPVQRKSELFASNMNEAIEEFSSKILSDIAQGIEYALYYSESELKEDIPDYDWMGAGYYALPDTPIAGREFYYPKGAKFDSYREDVYTYGIEEVE